MIRGSASPKLFVVFVMWGDPTISHFASLNMLSFRDGPLDERQSLDARSSTVTMSYIGVKAQICTNGLPTFRGAMQRVHEWSKLFDGTRVLSAVDPWWMLAQASCCTRLLVVGRSWSRQRQLSPGSLFRCSCSAKGGFDIGDDVSPSHLTADAAQVEH